MSSSVIRKLFSRAVVALFGRAPFLPDAMIDDVAQAIHEADDFTEGAWPAFEGDDGRRSEAGYIRLAPTHEIDTRRRQARAAARALGLRLEDA